MPLSWFYWYLRIHCFSMTRIPFLFFQSECNFRKARYSWYWILLTTCTSCVTFSTYLACLSCHLLLCAMWVTCLSPRVTRMKWDHVNKWYVTEKMLNTLCLSCFPSITLASPNSVFLCQFLSSTWMLTFYFFSSIDSSILVYSLPATASHKCITVSWKPLIFLESWLPAVNTERSKRKRSDEEETLLHWMVLRVEFWRQGQKVITEWKTKRTNIKAWKRCLNNKTQSSKGSCHA